MENILFKQSFMGFDRQQVLLYIDELSREMKSQADEYTRQQKKLETEIDSLSEKLSENSEKLNISMDNSAKLVRELEGLKQNNAEFKRQIMLYRNIIVERDREITRIKTDYNRLTEHKIELEKENKHWKERQDEIAACMVEASVRAKQIIDNATAEARRRKQELAQNASQLMDKVVDMKAEIAALETQLNRSYEKLSRAMRNMDKASSLIETQVNEYRKQVGSVDNFTAVISPDANARPKEEQPQTEKAVSEQPVVEPAREKKSLTETVLDSISRLLEK